MTCLVKGIPINYVEHGEGKPVLCIHGYSLDHRMMTGCMEPVFNEIPHVKYRRIYIDLPGMGQTPSGRVKTSEDMLEVIIGFIEAVIPNGNFLIAGESFGGFMTLGLISRIPERIDGVVLICPFITHECIGSSRLPEKPVLYKSKDFEALNNDSDISSFMSMAVIATPEIFRRYKDEILSGIRIADSEFLFNGGFTGAVPELDNLYKTISFDKPVCIITGRQDHAAGYSYAYELIDRFPRATFAVLDCAGHNLQIENEAMFNQLIKDWLRRTQKKTTRN
ncbi:MAG: alpha/beta hydrolase [Oscillospiraceae bacterium]|nr:alpha/beta hydrolase [Oscillospiraceae bacterium]